MKPVESDTGGWKRSEGRDGEMTRVHPASSLQFQGDGGLLHQLPPHPRGRHVHLDRVLLFWGEGFLALTPASSRMNE